MKKEISSTSSKIVGDLTGGVIASLMSVTASMAFGVLVFGVLGGKAASQGLVAGLTALALSNLASAFLGGCRVVSCSPSAMPTIMLAAAVAAFSEKALPSGAPPGPDLVFPLVFLVVLLSGVLQLIIGGLKLGELAKFVPFPVTCGLLTGTGLLIMRSQVFYVFGVEKGGDLWAEMKLGSVGVAGATCAAAWVMPLISKKVPAPIVALILGTGVYYLVASLAGPQVLGPLIGEIPSAIPTPSYAVEFISLFRSGIILEHLKFVVPLALGLSVVSSLATLVACIAGDSVSGDRSNTSRELLAQGLGNVVCSLFGGIAASGSPSRTLANYQYGARTRLSRVFAGLFALAVLLLIAPLVAKLPLVVLAGLLVVLAISILDRWILRTALDLLRRREPNPRVALTNLSIALLVAALMLVFGVLQAVGAGLLLSVIYFISRMGKQVVRRRYDGGELHSSVQRCEEEFEVLEREGRRLLIFELEGSLFFGTADKVAQLVEEGCSEATRVIILDLRLVAELDLTGAKILERTVKRCRAAEVELALSFEPNTAVAHHVETLGVQEAVGPGRCFKNVNDALGWAEELLLDEFYGKDRYTKERPLVSLAALSLLSAKQLEALEQVLKRREFKDGQSIFAEGDPGQSVLFIVQGRAHIHAKAPGAERDVRLATLCPGTLLGELAVIDGRPRSASARADGELVCYELPALALDAIIEKNPRVASKVLAGIGREIATRLRIADRTVR